MYGQLLELLGRRPEMYEKSSAAFWNDPHVSKGMLKAHLDPHLEAATREHAFVDRSVAWIRGLLPPNRFPKLLDLGCGPGLYAQRFSKCGYEVTGVDLSSRSIDYAVQSAEKQSLSIQYRLQDYLTLKDQSEYDIITLIYCDFGVLQPVDRQTLLRNAFLALRPGGRMLLDVFTDKEYRNKPEGTRLQYQEQGFWSDEKHAMIQSFFRYDEEKNYCDRYIVITSTKLNCYHIWNHAFSAFELQADFQSAGFDSVDFYSDVAGAPFSKKGRVLCAVAHKPV